jgi:UDP:flavonoid glycosyltransferase YjiC (YdhE family)
MNMVARLGAGTAMRAASMSAEALFEAATTILNKPSYAQAASRVGLALLQYDSGKNIREFVAEMLR